MLVRTVEEMIDALKTFEPSAPVISLLPPFTGVRLIEQSDGKVLFATPASDPDKNLPTPEEVRGVIR
jgi:hypothetical protein